MKIDAIDLSARTDNHEQRLPGWGVAISRKVWERCVAVPAGFGEVSEEERIGDLLGALWTAARRRTVFDPEWHGGFPFTTEVHRTEAGHQTLARRLWKYRPAVQLHALSSLDPNGSPYLLVLTPREMPCCGVVER
jgi:hypothetical protein